MTMHKITDVFSDQELSLIKLTISESQYEIDENLGRKRVGDIKNVFTDSMINKLINIASSVSGNLLSIDHAMFVEYNGKYGKPKLPPHFDGDTNDLIINLQLESNTSWDLGLNLETCTLEDNSALVFNGNTEIHWRVHKEFKPDEYIQMLFVRFYNAESRSDYSYLPNHPDDEVFKKVHEFRNSLI